MSFHEYCGQTISQFLISQHNVDFRNILEKIVVEEVEFDFHVSKNLLCYSVISVSFLTTPYPLNPDITNLEKSKLNV